MESTIGYLNNKTIYHFFSYVIVYEKGYQSVDVGLSSVTTKLKGTALTNLSIKFPVEVGNGTESGKLFDGPRIWDSSDYVIPPEVIDDGVDS